eukprot:Skav214346  [mRNA]  locus=scaffold86:437573:439055:+ [translate_table: standard]
MNQLSKSFEGVAPSCPKPSLQRPTLLRSCAVKLTRSLEEKKAGPAATNKGDLDTDQLASQLIKDALAEDAHLAGEDDMLCESEDEGLDEMDDDVFSLCGQSESEMSEGEGDLEDLAYSFAKGVVGQGANIDFAKAIQDAFEETAAVKDFVEISDFTSEADNEERNEEDLKDFYDLTGSGQDGLGTDEFEVETVQAKDDAEKGLQTFRQKAKQILLCAAHNGSLAAALQAARVPQVDAETMRVESLRLEARNAMVKAARNGFLAQALKQMGKVFPKMAPEDSKNPSQKNADTFQVPNAKCKDDDVCGPRAVKLAWSMAGPPARSLRQREVRKALARPLAFEKAEGAPLSEKDEPEKTGQRMTGSASAITLGLNRAKVLRCTGRFRCSSVGSLRPLKVKGPVLPPALPPTAFLQKNDHHEHSIAKEGI